MSEIILPANNEINNRSPYWLKETFFELSNVLNFPCMKSKSDIVKKRRLLREQKEWLEEWIKWIRNWYYSEITFEKFISSKYYNTHRDIFEEYWNIFDEYVESISKINPYLTSIHPSSKKISDKDKILFSKLKNVMGIANEWWNSYVFSDLFISVFLRWYSFDWNLTEFIEWEKAEYANIDLPRESFPLFEKIINWMKDGRYSIEDLKRLNMTFESKRNITITTIHEADHELCFFEKVADHERFKKMITSPFFKNYIEYSSLYTGSDSESISYEFFTYLTNPLEIHARIQELRYGLSLAPYDKFTRNHYDKASAEWLDWSEMFCLLYGEKWIDDFINLMNIIF